jgi:tRNA G26 N,N-dimethylase Trm1
MIEVFKTDINSKTKARQAINSLKSLFTEARINVDLHDRDKILRVEGIEVCHVPSIVQYLNNLGFQCETLA